MSLWMQWAVMIVGLVIFVVVLYIWLKRAR